MQVRNEDVQQGSDEWFKLRQGIPTCSEFKSIMTATTLKRSKSFSGYAYRLACERVTGYVIPMITTHHIERGNNQEDEAAACYAFLKDVDVKKVGFIYGDETKTYGGSPDALVGYDGGLEIKCKDDPVHAEVLHKGVIPSENRGQMYGSIFVTGRSWWDFLSYNPKMKPFIDRIERESEEYQKWEEAFIPHLKSFISLVEEVEEFLTDGGRSRLTNQLKQSLVL